MADCGLKLLTRQVRGRNPLGDAFAPAVDDNEKQMVVLGLGKGRARIGIGTLMHVGVLRAVGAGSGQGMQGAETFPHRLIIVDEHGLGADCMAARIGQRQNHMNLIIQMKYSQLVEACVQTSKSLRVHKFRVKRWERTHPVRSRWRFVSRTFGPTVS